MTGAEPSRRKFSKNHPALLKLARRFDDSFELPMQHAPGACFFGAKVSPAAFGIPGHGDGTVGVSGRGVDRQSAFESCCGEAAELLSFLERQDDLRVVTGKADHGLEQKQLAWALDGIGLSNVDKLTGNDWITMKSMPRGDKVKFPSELVLRRAPAKRKGQRPAESTGVAAGASAEDAVTSALLEVIERDAFGLWWFGGNTGRRISEAILEKSGFNNFAANIRQNSTRRWWLLDITSDLGIPVIASLSCDDNGKAIVAGFSSRTSLASAMKAAFLEMCQMELAQEISLLKFQLGKTEDLQDRDHQWLDRYRQLTLARFSEFEGVESANTGFQTLPGKPITAVLGQLKKCGHLAYQVNLSCPDIGVAVFKVLIPGLQSCKPDCVSDRLARLTGRSRASHDRILRKPSPI